MAHQTTKPSAMSGETETELDLLMATYGALRDEVAALIAQSAVTGAFSFAGPLSVLALVDRSNAPGASLLLMALPALTLMLSVWGYAQFDLLLKDGLFVSIIERRINRLVGQRVIDWNSLWSSARMRRGGGWFRRDKPGEGDVHRLNGRLGAWGATAGIFGFFLVVYSVMVVAGKQELDSLGAGFPKWLVDTSRAAYLPLHAILATGFGIWILLSRRSLSRQYTSWETFYALKPVAGHELTDAAVTDGKLPAGL
jgi:hypothetical protein